MPNFDDLTGSMEKLYEDMTRSLKGSGMGSYLFDVFKSMTQIGICIGTSFVYCLIFIGLLSLFAEPLCYLAIVLV